MKGMVLVDTGSDVTACGWDFGRGNDIKHVANALDLRSVRGQSINHCGVKEVPVLLTDDGMDKHPCRISFDVADVEAPVMSVPGTMALDSGSHRMVGR